MNYLFLFPYNKKFQNKKHCVQLLIKLLINYKIKKDSFRIPFDSSYHTRYPETKENIIFPYPILSWENSTGNNEIPHFFPPPNAVHLMRTLKVSWGNHPVSHPHPERGGLSSKIPGTEPLQPNSTAIRRRFRAT